MLDSGEKACVRARVRADGEVLLAAGKGSSRRRMIAAVGASLTLATAACQTAPFGHVSPRFEVSGETQSPYWSRQARLQSSTGKTYSPDVAARGNGFRFSNLPPGTYTLSVPDMCGEPHRKEGIVVRDSNVDVGLFDFSDGQECIIIGVMSRDEGNGYG
ncbi:MAG: hypothetical protein IE921_17935 [Rhodobacteraceae bacterium]|nr:hypothetical protein [Paracoccaceae bacterium]